MGYAVEIEAEGADRGGIEDEFGDAVTVRNVLGEWVVAGTRAAGAVRLKGPEGFSARFCPTADYDYDVASQEMAVHDAQHERIFHDFRWARREPPAATLKQLVERMQRTVTAVVAGR